MWPDVLEFSAHHAVCRTRTQPLRWFGNNACKLSTNYLVGIRKKNITIIYITICFRVNSVRFETYTIHVINGQLHRTNEVGMDTNVGRVIGKNLLYFIQYLAVFTRNSTF